MTTRVPVKSAPWRPRELSTLCIGLLYIVLVFTRLHPQILDAGSIELGVTSKTGLIRGLRQGTAQSLPVKLFEVVDPLTTAELRQSLAHLLMKQPA